MKPARSLGKGASQALDFASQWPVFVGLLAMEAIVLIGVIARYVFNRPLPFTDEYAGYLMVLVATLPLAWVLRRAGHIRIDLLVKAIPRGVANYIEVGTMLVSLVLIIILTIGTIQMVMNSFAGGVRAYSIMQTPLAPVQIVIPVGLSLFAIQILIEIVRKTKALGHARNAGQSDSQPEESNG